MDWISGELISNGWKLCALIDISRDGDVSVTVAVLGRRRISANSPKEVSGAERGNEYILAPYFRFAFDQDEERIGH